MTAGRGGRDKFQLCFIHLHLPEFVIVITIIIAGHQVTEILPFYLYGKKSLYQRRGVHFNTITIIAITSS